MKKIMISMAACAMMLSTSCSNGELIQDQQTGSREFSLTVDVNAGSRTIMDGTANKWDDNDAVYVFSEDKTTYGILRIDMATVSSDGKTATFKGIVNGTKDLKHVVFPAPEENNIPAPNNLRIYINQVKGNEHNAPMYGQIADNNSTFHYVGGLMKFDIDGVGSEQFVTFTAKANGRDIVGGYYKFDGNGLQYVALGKGEIAVTDFPTDGVVYLPVAVDQNYQGNTENAPKAKVTATLRSESNPGESVQIIGLDNISVSKGDIANETPASVTVTNAMTPVEVSTLEEANIAISNGKYLIKLTSDLNGKITIPANKVVTIDLNGNDVVSPTDDAFEVLGTLNIYGSNECLVQAGVNDDDQNVGNTGVGSVCAVWAHDGGTANIYGGHYVTVADNDGMRNDCIYAGSNSNKTAGFINIYSGTFEFDSTNIDPEHIGENGYDGDQFLLNGADDEGSLITVYGGEFKNHVPGKEPVASEGTSEVLVSVVPPKKVYEVGNGTEVSSAHSGNNIIWYVVK